MAYNKNSKYLRNAQQTSEEKEQQENDKSTMQRPTYRSSVMTPKRARELAEAAADALTEKEGTADDGGDTTQTDNKETKETTALPYRKEYRNSVMTPKRARELAIESGEVPIDEAGEKAEPAHHKGNSAGLFTEKTGSEAQKKAYDRASAKETNKTARHSARVRMVIAIVLFTTLSIVLLLFGKFHLPFVPELFTIEFSPVPELIVTIAYGPLFGVAISLVKNLISILIMPSSWISCMNNLILECIYLYLTAIIYSRLIKNKRTHSKGKRLHRYHPGKMFISSTAAALISLVPQFFITRYLAYPLMEYFFKGKFSIDETLVSYQNSVTAFAEHIPAEMAAHLPKITNISQGIALINLPITFGKLMLVTLVTLLILRFLLPFLQYRDKKAKQSITKTR